MIHSWTGEQCRPTGKHLMLPCPKNKNVMVHSQHCTTKCKYNLKIVNSSNVYCMEDEPGYLVVDLFYLLNRIMLK